MCGFKPGDEVVCVRDHPDGYTVLGRTYIVDRVWVNPRTGRVALDLRGVENGCEFGAPYFWGHAVSRFRKVKRRDLTAWLETASTFEEPKRKKARA